jgi:hypothetical protein
MAATALTWLQIINRVLVRLRESTVAANNTSDYSTHIGQVVNQVKTEIEEAFQWNTLRDTYTIPMVVGTTSYTFTGAGPAAVVIDGWNTTRQYELCRGTNYEFNQRYFGVATVQTGPVTEYIPAGTSADHDLKIDVWPKPDNTDTLTFTIYKPQADLAADGDVPLVPQNLLIEEVVARMLSERGDEGAQPMTPGQTFIRMDLLSSAIAREAGHTSDEQDWVVE